MMWRSETGRVPTVGIEQDVELCVKAARSGSQELVVVCLHGGQYSRSTNEKHSHWMSTTLPASRMNQE